VNKLKSFRKKELEVCALIVIAEEAECVQDKKFYMLRNVKGTRRKINCKFSHSLTMFFIKSLARLMW